jgi:hypothetical protein
LYLSYKKNSHEPSFYEIYLYNSDFTIYKIIINSDKKYYEFVSEDAEKAKDLEPLVIEILKGRVNEDGIKQLNLKFPL